MLLMVLVMRPEFERISTRERYYTLCFLAFWDICTVLTSSSQAVLLWREQEFNQLRSQLLDYGFPDYESNKELYKELGISKEALELYKTWNFNDRKYGDPFRDMLPPLKSLILKWGLLAQ